MMLYQAYSKCFEKLLLGASLVRFTVCDKVFQQPTSICWLWSETFTQHCDDKL